MLRICSAAVLLLSLTAFLGGCGSKEEPAPTPPEPPKVRAPEDDPLLKPRGSIMGELQEAPKGNKQNVNRIAAVVNGEMLTMHELRMHTAAELARRRIPLSDQPKVAEAERQVLDSMINDILMRQEAKRFKVTVSDAEVEEDLKKAIEQSGVPADQFEARIKTQGITLPMYKERIKDKLLKQRMAMYMVARKVFVTPEEIEEYYQKHKAEMVSEQTADFSILLVPEL